MVSFFVLFIYGIICYGLANTLIYAHGPFHVFDAMHNIAKKIHPQLEELLSCFICLSWWIGMMFSLMNIFLFPLWNFTPMNMLMSCQMVSQYWYVAMFLDGAFTSGLVWLINTIQDYYEKNTPTDEQ